MKILECPLLKNRIALGCIGLLGLSTFSGLMHTSASSGFFQQLSALFSKFGAESQGSQAQENGAQGKISPAAWVVKTGAEVWKDYITPFVTTAYDWAKTQDKRESVWGALKQFWNYRFFKGVISNLPWIVFDWVYILTNSEIRWKWFLAWKYVLSFFDWVVSQTSYKQHVSSFGRSFAELLFLPSRAINQFVNKNEQGAQQCQQNGGRGGSRRAGETTICISVTRTEAEKKK